MPHARIIPAVVVLMLAFAAPRPSSATVVETLLMPGKVNSSGGSTDILNSFLLWPTAGKYLIQNGWTLSYEFLFYGLFALGLGCGRYRYVIAIAAIVALVLAGQWLEPQGVWGSFLTNAILLEFVMGIAAFHLFKRGFRAGAALSVALIAIAIAGFVFTGELEAGDPRVIGYGVPSLALFIAVRSLEGRTIRFDRSLAGKVAGALGDSSYSMYLVHPFFLVAASTVLTQTGLASHGWLLIAVLFIGSMVTGWYCYAWLEKPMTQVVARMRRVGASGSQPRVADLNSSAIRGAVTVRE